MGLMKHEANLNRFMAKVSRIDKKPIFFLWRNWSMAIAWSSEV